MRILIRNLLELLMTTWRSRQHEKLRLTRLKTTIVGGAILHLSKAFMFRFQCEHIKQWLKQQEKKG